MSICWGATDFGRGGYTLSIHFVLHSNSEPGYDLANQTGYLDDMLRWGLDWLIKVCLFFSGEFSPLLI